MLKKQLLRDLKKTVQNLGYQTTDILLSIPKNHDFGDYTTNIALQLANQKSKDIKQSAPEIAKKIVDNFPEVDYLEKIEIAGNGFTTTKSLKTPFINFFVKESSLLENIPKVCNYSSLVNPEVEMDQEKKKILVEFAHPNTHKAFHIGHTRNIIIGESICRLLEANGNQVFRANYQGDIGLHVAKALWGVQKLGIISDKKGIKEKAEFLGKAYTKGAKAYNENEDTKLEIQAVNQELYARDPKIMKLWQKTRQWSLDYFESIYNQVGVKYDGLFFESEVEAKGAEIVRDNIGKVFEKDQGAIIFPGEKYGLHNRVFITSEGNPTYEAKDLGRAEAEKDAFEFDEAVHVVAVDQSAYFQVMIKALEMVDSWFVGKEMHLSYGLVHLNTGKMSSRTGEVVTFDWLFEEVKKKVEKIASSSLIPRNDENKMPKEEKSQVVDIVSIGAIKFSMLKYSPQTNITFDIDKSVSLQGDSGPYIQYCYARAKSVLRNAQYDYTPGAEGQLKEVLEKEERLILRQIEHFEAILEESASKFAPQDLAEYLLNLAKVFNLFYQKHPIIKARDKMEFRLALTCAVAVVLKQGLYLLGIEAPERM